jgi:hypothetical protein
MANTNEMSSSPMMQIADVPKQFDGLGYERIETIHGSTYKDNSVIIVAPTRGTIHVKVVQAWQSLIPMMNQKRAFLFATGHEVGQAYNALIENILANSELSKWKYILTLEDDNLPPPDALQRLIESIEFGKYDAVSGIYFTKGDFNMPMAYGNPDKFRATGELDFTPRNVVEALQNGNIMEVNGIAQGCSLYRMDLFREMKGPWFVTCNDIVPEKGGAQCFTQDLYFCEKARRAGKRFAVDFRVRVGHLDINTGIVY